jgi:hypothetical protein
MTPAEFKQQVDTFIEDNGDMVVDGLKISEWKRLDEEDRMDSSEYAAKWGGNFEAIIVSRMFPDVAIETLRIINGVFICIAWVGPEPSEACGVATIIYDGVHYDSGEPDLDSLVSAELIKFDAGTFTFKKTKRPCALLRSASATSQ